MDLILIVMIAVALLLIIGSFFSPSNPVKKDVYNVPHIEWCMNQPIMKKRVPDLEIKGSPVLPGYLTFAGIKSAG